MRVATLSPNTSYSIVLELILSREREREGEKKDPPTAFDVLALLIGENH